MMKPIHDCNCQVDSSPDAAASSERYCNSIGTSISCAYIAPSAPRAVEPRMTNSSPPRPPPIGTNFFRRASERIARPFHPRSHIRVSATSTIPRLNAILSLRRTTSIGWSMII